MHTSREKAGNRRMENHFSVSGFGRTPASCFIAIVSVLTAAGCASAPTVRGPDTQSGARADRDPAVAPDAIAWSRDLGLSWSLYQGVPQPASGAAAVTAYVLSYSSECDGRNFTYEVTALFLPRSSWVTSAVLIQPTDSRRLLQHEQTHFDLGEIQARKMRQALSELHEPCADGATAPGSAVAPLLADDAGIQQQYDRETDHGMDAVQQGLWETRVARALASLSRYHRPGSS